MKKNNIEEKIEQEIYEYFDNVEVPDLSLQKQDELKNMVAKNKVKNKKLGLWKKISIFTSSLCMVMIIAITTILLLPKNDNPPTNPPPAEPPPVEQPPIYYGKAEATKIQHDLAKTQEIISTQFPKYNFMFDDMNYDSSTGFYNPENNNLLALKISFYEKEIPIMKIEIHIIASQQFIFDDQENYIKTATYTETQNYKLYKITYSDLFSEYQRGYIIFDNHEVYMKFDRVNESLFNKFI